MEDAAQDGPAKKAIHATWEKLEQFTDGYYVNLNDTDAKDRRTDINYGSNFTRLAALKKQFDPLNLFRLNANISPA